MTRTRTLPIILILMLLATGTLIATSPAAASEYGDIDFDDIASGLFDSSAYVSEWRVIFAHDSGYMIDQGTTTATPVDTSSGTQGLGLINGAAGIKLGICFEGEGLITNGALRVTFVSPYGGAISQKNMIDISIGTSDSTSDAMINVIAYDSEGTFW